MVGSVWDQGAGYWSPRVQAFHLTFWLSNPNLLFSYAKYMKLNNVKDPRTTTTWVMVPKLIRDKDFEFGWIFYMQVDYDLLNHLVMVALITNLLLIISYSLDFPPFDC